MSFLKVETKQLTVLMAFYLFDLKPWQMSGRYYAFWSADK